MMRAPAMGRLRRWVAALIAVSLIAVSAPASARILKTKRPGQPGQGLALTIGSGFEYETDPEESEFGYPFLIEYELTKTLKLSAEPSYVQIRSKPGQRGTSVSGSGDFETTVEYEFIGERRHRPALTAEGIVKWPTAAYDAIGTHEMDYSIGLIVSKELVGFDLDFNALYTFVGSPPDVPLENSTEVGLASEWHVRPSFDLLAEVVTSTGGGVRGRSGSLGSLGGRANAIGISESLTEGTLGFALHLNDFLKLEQGVIAKSDGSFQAVFAWEWDFSGR